jgi:orotidine-5'-phosphate decarboxylase
MTDPATSLVRERLALALDVDDLADAVALAARLDSWFGIVKVGLELFAAAGPSAVEALLRPGRRVFVDLKLHDIPHTVSRAARQIGRLGAGFLTLHAAGGVDMLRAGVEGLADGAATGGHAPPIPLGVTVLTSEPDVSAFPDRLQAALAGGCGGVVCSVREVAQVKAASSALVAVVPGIRLPGGDVHDQARVGSPEEALAGGADVLVVGRAVTAAADPETAAVTLVSYVQSVVAKRARQL